jgi:hypothetical protein
MEVQRQLCAFMARRSFQERGKIVIKSRRQEASGPESFSAFILLKPLPPPI